MDIKVAETAERRPALEPPDAGNGQPSRQQGTARMGRRAGPWRWAVALCGLLCIAALSAMWLITRPRSGVSYISEPVTRGDILRTIAATGTVNPELTVIVGSYVSGVIQKLFCDYNTEVKAGQACAKIDPRPYQTIVDQSRANLKIARAQLEKDNASLAYALLRWTRYQKLAKDSYASQDLADNAKSLYDAAVAQVALDQATIEQRGAELDAANVNLGYTDIVSPVDGTVVSRNVTQGQTVASSFQTPTLFLIATDLTRMQVDTNVSESDIGSTRLGNSASFTVDAFPGRVFEGKVTQVRQSPQTVQNVVTFDAVVSVSNAELALKPGMTASTRIVTDKRLGVLRVPQVALRYHPNGGTDTAAQPNPAAPTGAGTSSRVWVLRNGVATPIDVVTGLDDDHNSEIVSGDLKPGDKVIIGEAASHVGKASALSRQP